MNRLVHVLFLSSLIFGSAVGCKDNGAQTIAPAGYTCVPGQPCPVVNSCAPGTVGCALTSGTGYVHFTGELAQINNDTAKQMIRDFYNVWFMCWGNCYSFSTVDIVITPNPSGLSAQVTLNLGGYPISGQAVSYPVNNSAGTDLRLTPFGASALRVDILSNNFPLDGSVTAIPAIEIQYNGQHLALTSLLRAGF